MKNVMVCVTQQKTCDRLIKYGYDLLDKDGGELFIIHVSHPDFNFLGKTKDGDALEYLYEKALEYGANLTVMKSEHILATLIQSIDDNAISHVILGESGEKQGNSNLTKKLERKISNRAEVIIIPA